MDNLIADVSDIDFIIESQLENQIGLGCLPFSNMNKSGAGVCRFFITNQCPLNNLCPLRHIKADRTVVCKHWLRGLCKKGDDCEFLHEYDMTKMPECYFFSKFGECMNKECPFLHIDPASKVQDCPWYDRGFCRNGPLCRNRHVRRVACKNYINGFCPKGRECKYAQ
uniref:Cleavage and polyadenylation specificity factor subunit 4 n=1 Tax=Schistosoma mansoni TaxID=6183 RepID=A0A5K4F9M8_SCHMA